MWHKLVAGAYTPYYVDVSMSQYNPIIHYNRHKHKSRRNKLHRQLCRGSGTNVWKWDHAWTSCKAPPDICQASSVNMNVRAGKRRTRPAEELRNNPTDGPNIIRIYTE